MYFKAKKKKCASKYFPIFKGIQCQLKNKASPQLRRDFPGGSGGKNLPAMRETWVQSLGWEDPLEKGKATHSRILAWRIPWGHKELDTTGQLSLSITQVHSQQLHKDENYGNF